jgi:hypothetical protein
MAGYSGTPLPKKLGIKPAARVGLILAPAGIEGTLGALPDGVELCQGLAGASPFDVVLLFARSRAELERRFAGAARRIAPDGGLWVAWPKRASGVQTDMTEDVAREIGLPLGLVDVKVCAIDETWSGLRFVWRLERRPSAPGRAAPGAAPRRRKRMR